MFSFPSLAEKTKKRRRGGVTFEDCVSSEVSREHDEDEASYCPSSQRFTVSNAAVTPKQSVKSPTAVAQTDYIPMDYEAELEACSDVVFSASSYYCTVPTPCGQADDSDMAAADGVAVDQDYAPYDHDAAICGDDTGKASQGEAYSEEWKRRQEALFARHVEGRHYAWCQRMAGESCFSNQEQGQYALKTLLREACARDLAHLRAMPASAFAPCGSVEERRIEVNRSASCTSMTSLTAYMEAQQLRASYLDGGRRCTDSEAAARKATYVASAAHQWRRLGEYVTRELSEDAMRLRCLSNTIQQLCLFRAEPVAPDLEVIFNRCTSARPNTPYSTLFCVSRELDLTLVESQKRQRKQHAEEVLATLASHRALFIPPTLHAEEVQLPVPVAHAALDMGAVGHPLTAACSPASAPAMHSPLFSLILDPSELEATPLLLLDVHDADTEEETESVGDRAAAAVASPWEISLPWPASGMENELSSGPHAATISLRPCALSWTDLHENESYADCPNTVLMSSPTPNATSGITSDAHSADITSPSQRLMMSNVVCQANNSSPNNRYALPFALLSGKHAGETLPTLSATTMCGAMSWGDLRLDASPSRFSTITEGQSSEGGDGTCISETHQTHSGACTSADHHSSPTRSPDLVWLAPPMHIGEADACTETPRNIPHLSLELLQHHAVSDGASPRSQAGSLSGRARTHLDIESICRGWLFNTTTCHLRSSSTESGATEHGADYLTFCAEMIDDEDVRLDAEETPLTL